jgi:hypothetical protein
MMRAIFHRQRVLALLIVATAANVATAAEPSPADSLPSYLAAWELDHGRRAALSEPGGWSGAKQSLVLRLMARLARVPADRMAGWQAAATDVSSAVPGAASDVPVRIEGRAVFVAPQRLSAEEAALAGRDHLDVVRLVTATGTLADVIVESAPAAWPRWTGIDEKTSVVGLPLTTGPGPVPAEGERSWPSEPPAVVVLGMRLSWYPTTFLGTLGMDYAAFDTVADGKPLVAGDTEAFYALLAAAGRTTPEAIAAAAGGITDVLPLIDPAEKWFAGHRGDAVTLEGTVRRATRIAIDDDARRRQVGRDHYWELYVFVPTPLIRVDDQVQDDFPIVCCVRSLPAGMPTGDRIAERVRVSGFALKRYAYPLQAVRINSSQGDEERRATRRETPLVIGSEAIWLPGPSSRRVSSDLGWVLAALAAAVGLLLGAAVWAARRSAGRAAHEARERLPDRIDLPPAD